MFHNKKFIRTQPTILALLTFRSVYQRPSSPEADEGLSDRDRNINNVRSGCVLMNF